MAENKRIYNTEIINKLLSDAAQGLEIDTGAFYMGDLELRNNNIVFEYTDEEIEEFQKCAADPVYFISNYCKFQTDLGRKLVKLYPFQEDIIRTICNEHYDSDVGEMVPDNRNCITMASRQVGKTTTISSIFAWYLCFNIDKNVIVLANKDATSKEIVDKIIQIFRGLPFWLKPGAMNFGKTGLTLDNGCRLISSATTASTSIGFTIHKLYLDEFAHIPASIIEPFWRSVYPTMASSKLSQCIITSTPNGTGNLFYDIYSKSSNGTGENSFKAIRVDYWQVPGHDDEWAAQMKRDFGEDLFAQEFGLQFNTSSKMLLKASDMQFMERIKRKFSYRYLENYNPIFADRRVQWHPNFDPKNISSTDRFVFSIDLAEGNENNDIKNKKDKSDYNIINIFKVVPNSIANIKAKNRHTKVDITDCVKFVQVGLFRDNINDEEYCANMTSALLYDIFDVEVNDNVRILVEMNFQGKNYTTHLKLHPKYFDSIIVKTPHSEPVPGEKAKKKLGYKTTTNKTFYCKKGADLIGKRRLIVSENESINQLGAFGEVKGKSLGGFACHDDISMTIVNAIPRMIAESSCLEFFEELIEVMENQNHKYAINLIIQKWELENPEMSDNMYNALYGNKDNSMLPYNLQLSAYNNFNPGQTYGQMMKQFKSY